MQNISFGGSFFCFLGGVAIRDVLVHPRAGIITSTCNYHQISQSEISNFGQFVNKIIRLLIVKPINGPFPERLCHFCGVYHHRVATVEGDWCTLVVEGYDLVVLFCHRLELKNFRNSMRIYAAVRGVYRPHS